MRSLRSIACLTAALVVLPAAASAGGITIAAGGPERGERRVQEALGEIAPALSVCWRGRHPRTVKVGLRVAADGRIGRARQKTRGAAAQCAAGVLAVHTLPATGDDYWVGVAIDTRGAGVNLHAELRRHRGALEACGGRHRGQATVRFSIHPDGRISDPTIVSTTVKDRAVKRCLLREVSSLRVAERPGGKTVRYSLDVGLGAGAKRPATKRVELPDPKKRGPLPGSVIAAGVEKLSDRFARCYRKRNDRAATGYVMFRFTVRADGTVRNVKVKKSTVDDRRVESCVVKVGRRLRFPAEEGRAVTKVWYPIPFSPRTRP